MIVFFLTAAIASLCALALTRAIVIASDRRH
jgi:hypothetical protein